MKKTLMLLFFTSTLLATSVAQIPQDKETIFVLLTGGSENSVGKQWRFSPSPNKSGIGNKKALDHGYWNYFNGLTDPYFIEGLLDNAYTFRKDSVYIPDNQNATIHWAHANVFFGKDQPTFVDIALKDSKHVAAPFKLKKGESTLGTGFVFTILNNSYLGYFQNRTEYEILKLTEDSLYIRQAFSEDPFTDPAEDTLVRYFTLVKGSIVTSVDKSLSNSSVLAFYPNPAKDIVTLQENVSSASVYNSTGEILLKGEGKLFNIATLPSGLYIVRIQYKEGDVNYQKLLKE